jgi:hypothetical protein
MAAKHAYIEMAHRSVYWRAFENTPELHLTGLMGTANHPYMQEIRIIGFFFENDLHWQFDVRLLLFTVCTGV